MSKSLSPLGISGSISHLTALSLNPFTPSTAKAKISPHTYLSRLAIQETATPRITYGLI